MSTSVHVTQLPSLVLEQVFEWGCTEKLEPQRRYNYDQPVNRRVRHPFLSNVSEVCHHWHATAQHAPPSCWFIVLRLRVSYPEGITIAGVLEEYREALETSKRADLHVEWQCLGFTAGVKADLFIKAMNMVIPYQSQIRTLSCNYSEDILDRNFYSFVAQLDRAHSLHSMYHYGGLRKDLGGGSTGDYSLPSSFQVRPGALLGLGSLRTSVDSESLAKLVPPQNLSSLHLKCGSLRSIHIFYSDIVKLVRQLPNLTYLVFPKSMVLKFDDNKPMLEPPSNRIPLLSLSYLRVHQSDPLVAMAVLTCSEFRNLKRLELNFTLKSQYSQDSFKEYRLLECPNIILPDFCYIKVNVAWPQIDTLAVLSRFMRPLISRLTIGCALDAVDTPEPTKPFHISVDRLWLMEPSSEAFDSLFNLVNFDILNTLQLDLECEETCNIDDWITCWERHRSQLSKVNKLDMSSLDLQRGLFPTCLRCFANIKHFTCRLQRPWESEFPGSNEGYHLSTVFDYFLPGYLDGQLPFPELTTLEVVAEAVGQDDQVLVEDIESGLEKVAVARAEFGAPVQITSNARDRLRRHSSSGYILLE